MPLRCLYTDLDGTLLGRGASLFRDAEGNFTQLPARALEACHRADVEVVIMSGRRRAQVMEGARGKLGEVALRVPEERGAPAEQGPVEVCVEAAQRHPGEATLATGPA